MKVIICPGIHPPELTQNFLTGLGQSIAAPLIFPADRYPAYSAKHILRFLYHQLGRSFDEPVLWIGFSAGVVGAIGAAHLWAMLGGKFGHSLHWMDGAFRCWEIFRFIALVMMPLHIGVQLY